MKTKSVNRINGGIAIYYGFGMLIPTIGCLIGLGYFLFDFFTTDTPFIWWQFALLSSLALISGVIAYVLILIGYEQVEE